MTTEEFIITYAHIEKDEDEPELIYKIPNFNIIGVSTQDSNGKSVPRLFFVPKSISLPISLLRTRCVKFDYNKESEYIQSWLNAHSEHVMDMDVFVTITNNETESNPVRTRLIQ